MAKSVPNPEFVAVHNAALAPHGFVRRAKGQRAMRDLIPFFLFASDLPVGYSIQSVGHGQGYLPSGKVGVLEYLVVTTPRGCRVPATRWVEVGQEFNICQSSQYVPAKLG